MIRADEPPSRSRARSLSTAFGGRSALLTILAMLTGAATRSRALAVGIPTAVFAASYLVVGLAGLVSWMKPLRYVSPLYRANGTLPLRDGLPDANYALLMALCAAAIVGAVAAFDRHELAR